MTIPRAIVLVLGLVVLFGSLGAYYVWRKSERESAAISGATAEAPAREAQSARYPDTPEGRMAELIEKQGFPCAHVFTIMNTDNGSREVRCLRQAGQDKMILYIVDPAGAVRERAPS